MKQYTVFTCDICEFESKDHQVMLQHEANHYNLTIEENSKYKHMIGFANFCLKYALDENVPVYRRQKYKEQYQLYVANIKKFELEHQIPYTEWKEI